MKCELIILIIIGLFIACSALATFWLPDANDRLEPLDNTWGLRIPSLANCDTTDTDADGVFSCGTDAGIMRNDWYISGTTIMYASTTRTKIGIGTTTPSVALSIGSTTGSQFLVNSSGVISDGIWQATAIASTYLASSTQYWTSYIHSQDNSQAHTDYLLNTGDTAAGDYTFDTTTLKIDASNDRVGVGTSTPEYTLDVIGQAKIDATTTIRARLIVDDRSSSGTTTLQIGSTTTQNVGCLKMFDTDRLGWTYCTTDGGVITCSTAACE